MLHGTIFVATRVWEFFPVLYFSCFALRKVSLISTFVSALGVVFLLAFFHMCILSVFLVSVSVFVSSLGLLFSVQFSIKCYFVVYVNQSLSCIRRCRKDLVSIVFPVSFARFLTHFLYFKLSFLEGFRSPFINSVFSFFCCNCSSESRRKSRIQTVRECFLQFAITIFSWTQGCNVGTMLQQFKTILQKCCNVGLR